ncbi:MAG: hypothetical protein B0D94_06040 [Candidatus Sedimenticola endophacoides]|nr:MAG: hypothetical protein B0D94_06040 [Candidatus Sedimenticola endophacoides]
MKPIDAKYPILLLLLLLLPGLARAVVNSVSVTSVSTSRVALGQPATAIIRWGVSGSGPAATGAPPPTIVRSTGGTFQDTEDAPGIILGSTPGTLSSTVTGSYSVSFTESVVIPASVIYKAYKNGLASFVLYRRFNDGYAPGTYAHAAATFRITGGANAGFNINRQALYFDDGSRLRLLSPGQPLSALSELRYSGSGLLRGVWELATPETTDGEPVYRRLQTVRRVLGGGGRVLLPSPALDTALAGRYLVRFRIEEPVTGFDDLLIEYHVGRAEPQQAPLDLELDTPRHGAFLHPDTHFRWRPVAGASGYRLELFEGERDAAPLDGLMAWQDTRQAELDPRRLRAAPVSGAALPSGQTGVTLSDLSRGHLQPGRGYWWRVLAIGADGRLTLTAMESEAKAVSPR